MDFLYCPLGVEMQGTKRGILSGNGENASSSEHDFKDLQDLQDGVASCKSFHPQNRVQDEGKGVRGASRKGVFLCDFAS